METPIMLRTLAKEQTGRIPVWFMRQAGRYLPEYQAIRKGFSNFLEFCYTPDAACEVTLQPITRFDMDAAILFSDILVIPDALGQDVRFVKGEGPKLEAIASEEAIQALNKNRLAEHLDSVMQAIKLIRKELADDKALIGFSGSPWTLACYMIEGSGSKDFGKARAFAKKHPQAFTKLLALLSDSIADYCLMQIEAGVQVIQLFDSWTGMVPAQDFDGYVTQPTKQIVDRIKAKHPNFPVIGFAKSAGANLLSYANQTGVDALGLDQMVPLDWAKDHLTNRVFQGNLDNITLAESKEEAVSQTRHILESWADHPFIFNLGHGILPHTPIAHVEAVLQEIREWKRT